MMTTVSPISERPRLGPLLVVLAALWASDAYGAPPTTRPSGVPAGLRKVGPIAGGWVLPSGRLLRPWADQIELPGQPFSVAVSPDGKTGFLLVAANRFWDPWTPDATLLTSIDRRTVPPRAQEAPGWGRPNDGPPKSTGLE